MTIDEMFNELEDKVRDTVIVTLKYKYEFEEKYTIENHILEYDAFDDSYFWLNDWYEGQTDIEVLGYIPLGEVDTTKLSTCEDCISREKVFEQISCWVNSGEYRYTNATYYLARRIQGISSVTPQPKIGHWIRWYEQKENDGCIEHIPHCKCSECGKEYEPHSSQFVKYCSKCGAKMEEEE